MINKSLINNSAPHILLSQALETLVADLDEQNQELLLGGCFSCQDIIRPKLNRSDNSATNSNQYVISSLPHSIPTLM